MKQLKHYGELKSTHTWFGTKVTRSESLFVIEWKSFVKCAPYDNHFIFENPDKRKGVPSYLCTCGASAVIIGKQDYLKDSSEEGGLFVCLSHAQDGKHLDGSS